MRYDITYMWNLKYDKNEHICETNRLTDIENRLVVVKGLVGRGELDWEFGISRCIEWMNKILLYSTGNYIQYPVINHNEKLHIHTHALARAVTSVVSLCDPTDCSLPGTSVHGILQSGILG